jgi:hypothetical protein
VCTAGRSKAVSPAPHNGFPTVPPYSTLGYQPNGLWEKWLGNDDSLRMHCGRDLLQLSISAHDPKRTSAIPKLLGWSLIAANVVSHGRYVAFQMAEAASPPNLFADTLRMIAELRPPPLTSTA